MYVYLWGRKHRRGPLLAYSVSLISFKHQAPPHPTQSPTESHFFSLCEMQSNIKRVEIKATHDIRTYGGQLEI